MTIIVLTLLASLPYPTQPLGGELGILEASFSLGYYGFRYTTLGLPELRANGCLHDMTSDLNLKVGYPTEIGRWVLYPHGDVKLKTLCFVGLQSTYWEIGLGDASAGLETFVSPDLSFNLDVLLPTGNYLNRLGEGHWAVLAGIGYHLQEEVPLKIDLLWQGQNPDGINVGDGAIVQVGYRSPTDWLLSSSLGAFLPDNGGPFDMHDRFTLDLSVRIRKQYRISQQLALDLWGEQTLWGLDTEVWTRLGLYIHLLQKGIPSE